MKTLRGFLLSTTVLALGIAIIGEASAAQPKSRFGFDDGYHDDHNFDYRDDSYRRGKRLQVINKFIYKEVFGQETLPIRKILNLQGPAHAGKKVKYVSITAKKKQRHRGGRGGRGGHYNDYGFDNGYGGGYGPRPGRQATAQLLIDGRPVGYAKDIPNYMSEIKFELPKYQNVLGHDIRRLQVEITGRKVMVEKVEMGLKKKRGQHHPPAPQYLARNMHEIIVGRGVETTLASLMAASYSEQQASVTKVTVYGKSARGMAEMQVCEKSRYSYTASCSRSQNVSQYSDKMTFYMNSEKLEDLVLKTRGRIVIDRIELEFQRYGRF